MTARVALLLVAGSLLVGGPRARGQEPDLASVIRRASAYAAAYQQRFSGLVAEERYVQEATRPVSTDSSRFSPSGAPLPSAPHRDRRVLRSDYLLVRIESGDGWMPFRDVFEVDGSKVHDRQDRLTKLFLQPSASALEQATKIMQDSTRHNIGSVTRTINVPLLALLFFLPDLTPRFAFALDAHEQIDGRDAVRVTYKEVARPSLIRTRRSGQLVTDDADLPAEGKAWIDPANGTLLKTLLLASDAYVSSQITVTFREEPELHLWVPAQMEERYVTRASSEEILGKATYSKYRRFKVSTDETIKKPGG